LQGFRVSPQQARLWAAAQADRHWPLFASALFEVEGELDDRWLEAAVEAVVAQHEILRTQVLPSPEGAPLQIIAQRPMYQFHLIEAAAVDGEGLPESTLRELAARDPNSHLAVWYIRRLGAASLLMLRVPALVSDGRGLCNLAGALLRAYAVCRDGRDLRDEPLQYADIAEAFCQLLESEATRAGREYWRDRWSSDVFALRFSPAPSEPTLNDGGCLAGTRRVLPGELALRLLDVARAQRASLEALLAACWLAVLCGESGSSNLCLGVVVEGRDFEGLAGALGPFARCLPLRAEVAGRASLRDLVQCVGRELAEMRRFQDYFAAQPGSFVPFGFEFRPAAEIAEGGLKLRVVREQATVDRFHLLLSMAWDSETPELTLAYDARIYGREGVEGLADGLVRVLERCAPSARVRSLCPSALHERTDAGPDQPAEDLTATERLVSEIWAELFGIDGIGAEEDFFELGGDSVLAAHLVSRVRSALKVELPVRALFEAPTVFGLAERIDGALRAGDALSGPPIERVDRSRPLPLSFAQQRLWFLHQLEADSPAYNISNAVLLTGELSLDSLAQSLGELVRRHEVLRTVFESVDGEPVQVIRPASPFPLPLIDLSGLDVNRRNPEQRRLALEEAQRPFALVRGPLLRVNVVRLTAQEHAVLTTMHHIVSDGWSKGIFSAELMSLYEASTAGRPSPLPELPVQYADFAVWQRRWLSGEVLERKLRFWRQSLRGAPSVLELPTDRPRPALQSWRGAVRGFELSGELPGALRQLVQRRRVTLFTILLSVFEVLISRWSGQLDLSVGTPIAGRTRLEVESLIGMFVNTLVLRGDLSGDPTWGSLLERTWNGVLEAYVHQDVPFEKLVEDLVPERHLSHSPLFQVMLALQSVPEERAGSASGLRMSALPVGGGSAATFDLTLAISERDGRLFGGLEYNTDLFDGVTIGRLLVHFENVLRGIAEEPERRISALPLLSEWERAQVVVEWNERALERFADGRCVHELFAEQAARTPEAIAVMSAGRSLSYSELDRRANQWARRLQRLGVGPGSIVGLCLDRCPEMVEALFGVLKAGAAYLPLDPTSPQQRLEYMLKDAGASVLVSRGALGEALSDGTRWSIDLEREGGQPSAESREAVAARVGPEDRAYVIYTSGSTGAPRGVIVRHESLASYARVAGREFALGPGDRLLQFASFAFDTSAEEIFSCLLHGATLVLRPEDMLGSLPHFVEVCEELGLTVLDLPTALWHELTLWLEKDGAALPASVRMVVVGGEQILRDRVCSWRRKVGDRVRLWNGYGPTETTIVATFCELTGSAGPEGPAEGVTIGSVVPGGRAHVLDRDFRPVPMGVAGELCIGGVGLARGYLGLPELTAERFLPDPFGEVWSEAGSRLYRTGDLARHLPDGRLQFLGRIDHQLKIRGFRIELGEIEAALAMHPSIVQAVVAAMDEDGEKRLVAYLVGRESEPVPIGRELRGFLQQSLPEYMVPSAFVVLEALPRTLNGKVDWKALPRPQRTESKAGEPARPRGHVQEAVVGIWSEILGVAGIGVGESFFELGGHSLLATRVLSRVRAAFGVELPVRVLFEAPTVAGLAERIEGVLRSGGAALPLPIARVDRTGPLPLSFAQQRLWFLHQLDPESPAYNISHAFPRAGALDLSALERSLSEVARRHEALRTVFESVDGEPRQVVRPASPIRVPLVDLGGLGADCGRAEHRRLELAEAQRPFDLVRGPLFRGVLVQAGREEHTLFLTLHHIVADGWSLKILKDELAALYEAFSTGRPSPLADPVWQYLDLVAWQRGWLQSGVLEAQLAFWKQRLSPLPAPLGLPLPRPQRAGRDSRGAGLSFSLPAEAAKRLRTLCWSADSTLFMALLAALDALLLRYTGQTDLCVGTPVAGRNRLETESVIGLFLNTLVIRTDLSGDPTFRELLIRVREASLGAYAHQDLPLEVLIEALQPDRDLARTPLFQVFFNLVNFDISPAAGDPAPEADLVELSGFDVKFDLALHVVERRNGIELQLHWAAELFDPVQMVRLVEHLRFLLEAVAREPERRLSEFRLESAEARQSRRRQRRPKEDDLPEEEFPLGREESIPRRFTTIADRHSGRVAVETATCNWTYGQLDRGSESAARSLLASAGRTPVVALLCGHEAPMVAAVLAALKAGKSYVPLDPSYPEARLGFMLRDSLAGAVLADASHLDLARDLCGGRLPILTLDLEGADGGPSLALPEVVPEALAYTLYTSGSTGEPKGVVQSHRNVLWHIRAYAGALQISPADRLSLLASYSFDAAVMDLFGALLNGATLCPFDVRREGTEPLAEWLERAGITILHSTPTLFRRFLDTAGDRRFSTVRRVVLGGEKCLQRDFDRFRKHFPPTCVFVNGLGPTESTLALQSFASVGDRVDRETVPVGYPVAGAEVRLWNRAGEQLAVYGIGEIVLKSPALALGYWRRPDLTAGRFLPDPEGDGDRVYHTGDLGRWLPDGRLEFVGRGDSQVKVRGYRIEIGEIESRLNEVPGVREAMVLAREEEGETRLAAYLLAGEPAAVSSRELREALKRHLPDFMIPGDFVVLDAWPLTPTGKVDPSALPAPVRRREVRAEDRSSLTPVEELLCGLWQDLLRVEGIGVSDDFFMLGGHSLLATQLVSRVRTILAVEIPLRWVFEAPTVAGLAGRIEALAGTGEARARPPLTPVPRTGELPLSFAQERLWFLDRLQPGSSVYHMPYAIRLSGGLDLPALAAVFTEIVRRHEVLRTTFAESGGVPLQVVAAAGAVPLPVIALDGLPPERREEEARRLVREEADLPFDLARGPLFRVRLLRLQEAEHGLLLTLHHIAGDGWSSGVLQREVSKIYNAFSQRRPSPLAELPVQYANYACWQREWLRGEPLEAQLAYWRESLRGVPERLDLPLDRPRSANPSLRGGVQRLSLPADLSLELRRLGLREGSTPFMVFLAALQALLARLTGEEDLCVGTPAAGRTQAEVEDLIGLFVNTLVLRGDLSGDPPFRQLLRRARETALQAHAHQDLPFERLVEALQPERSLNVSPLFQVMLALQNVRRDPFEMEGLSISSPWASAGSAKFDLSMTMVESPRGVFGSVEYPAAFFEATTIARWTGHFQVFLEAVAGDPERRLSELPLLAPAECHQLLVEWTDTAAVDERDERCLHELVEAQIERTPGAVAAVFGDDSLTYRQLGDRSLRLAASLIAGGIGAGSFVPVLIDRGLDLLVALLAVMRARAAFVPLDLEWPAARLEAVLDEIGSAVILTGLHPPPLLAGSRLQISEAAGGEGLPLPAGSSDPGAPIYAMYTSGSTGKPKGVVVPHRGIVNRFLWMDRFFGEAAAAAVLQTTRYVYDSVVWQIFWPLIHGGTTVLTAPGQGVSPADVAELIERHRITLADFVPSVFHYFVEQLRSGAEPTRLESLRAVVVGGEEMSAEDARTFLRLLPEPALVNLYGPTEASIGCICYPVREVPGGRVPIGHPISNVHPVILDRWGKTTPVGVAGELCLAGRCLGSGYLDDEEQSRRAFVANPVPEIGGETIYRTGDLARRRPDGAIDFLGRIDHQVKIRGLRIELGEIEAALREHPDVEAAAVLALEEDRTGARAGRARLVACVVPHPGREIREPALKAFLKEWLPAYMVPSTLVPLDTLPLTAGGKVDRRALARLAPRLEMPQSEEGKAGPGTPFEELLAGIWCEVLRVDRAGPEDDFFALGGHSLLATQVVSRVRRSLGVELPVRALFEDPTLAGLARRIESALLAGERSEVPPVVPVPRDRELPLSFAQQRLWFLDKLTPGAGVYKLFNPLRLRGELAPGALVRAVGEVARRHESLRTAFPSVEGRPIVAIAPASPAPLPLVDLSGLPREMREREGLSVTQGEGERSFELARGPLFRALLVRAGTADHSLLLSVHHIVCDGWSIALLLHELAGLYRAFCHDEASPLPELPIQYADFAVWQQEWLQGEVLEQEVEYWRGQLASAPPVLELPIDRPRPPVQTFRGGRFPFTLSAALTAGLTTFSRRTGCTLFMTLLAGFDALLHRYSGQPRILVGTPIANRNLAEVEDLIGNFANTLVLGVEVDGGLPFRALMERVREVALGAYAHQDLPFETVVDALNPQRDLSYNPVFQVLLALHNLPRLTSLATGLEVMPLTSERKTARLDLALDLAEAPDGLRGTFEYATDLFDAVTVGRMAGHLTVLLESAVDQPERRVLELPLLTEVERHQLLAEWNPLAAIPPGAGRCLHGLFESWAERSPDACAVVCGGERLTYGGLNRRANALAHRLRRLGVGPDVPVGLFLQRSLDLVVAMLGVLKAGGAYVPLDPAYPKQRLEWILEASEVPVLVTRRSQTAALPEVRRAEVLELESLEPADANLEAVAGPDHRAYVMFTSGSTGRPKGVEITHRSAVHLLETTQPLFGFGPGDVWTVVHSYAFDFSVWEIWSALAHGGRLVVVPLEVLQSPEALAALLTSERVTVFNQTPAAARQLLESGGATAETALKSLRMMIVGGEALPSDLAQRLLETGTAVWNFYGPTESTVWATAGQVAAEAGSEGSVPLGRPLPDNRLLVLGPGLQPLPAGVAGELCIAGAGLARGYSGDPRQTAEKFMPDPFGGSGRRLYRTGDLARTLPDGTLDFLGRLDQQVKVRGFRIELGEIEAVLSEHPGVRQAVAGVLETSPGDKALVAWLVSSGPRLSEVEELSAHATSRLPGYMVPSYFVPLEALPVTANGKVDRQAISRLGIGGRESRAERVPARDPLESRLIGIWESLLPGRFPGVSDNFFDLGGHSMLAVRLVSRIRAELGHDLPLSELFRLPTVEKLAAALRENTVPPTRRTLVEIESGGRRNPFFWVHPIGGSVLCYFELARVLGPDQPFYGLQAEQDPAGEPAAGIEEMASRYIAAVREVRPLGPYRLGGWSMGGLVAFEMARQLSAQGEWVEILALVDVLAPSGNGSGGNGGGTDLIRAFASNLVGPSGKPLSLSESSGSGGEQEVLRRVFEWAQRERVLPGDLGFSDVEQRFRIFKANRRAIHGYVAREYPGSMALIMAKETFGEAGGAHGWDALAAGGVDLRVVPGDHFSLLRRPQVEVLGGHLRDWIGSLEA
jgi:amino acid adenylation domain-containing protein